MHSDKFAGLGGGGGGARGAEDPPLPLLQVNEMCKFITKINDYSL